MRLLTSQMIFAACVVSAHALSAPPLPNSVTDDCPTAHVVSSTTISVDGQEILRESFVCPDGKFANHAMSGSGENVTANRSTLEAREEIECMFPQNMPAVCQCGAQCKSFERFLYHTELY
ncbi:uncharacterized protein FOMMEDRAFT_24286 [Fomitiporia mediterranea MF3/22]|uniref:Uncharacterized protein n=1 Tax=Fomitiporia mediterranea (strain MF3/22) TaxID=694068 RepID=R7SG19_FOMME|nr:uncharacterized protein FOMMEDRAFT_24286 [Fomitiporia mediterranea MF3/22]EJC97661.1 hypothetical protein FOMMEDRAFT_24286 [Fomitiporia mediterranea MF3/22]